MSGQEIGHLAVLSYAGSRNSKSMWNCKCVCGKTLQRSRIRLKEGGPKSSCGCVTKSTTEDLTGRRFGKLVAIKREEVSGLR